MLEGVFIRIKYKNLRHAFKIQSHLSLKERVWLHKLSLKATNIAEIGSYIGASASCFGAELRHSKTKKIICIDTWNNHAMSEGKKNTWREFEKNTFQFRDRIYPIRGFSTEVVKEVCEISRTIDLLFIDGDHSYEGVKADWMAYKKFLKIGSIVVFHDYGWAEGVKRVIDENVTQYTSFTKNLPNMWWGVISRKP